MLRPLSRVRRKVEQLAASATLARCGGYHRRHRAVVVRGDEPVPAWPEAESGERCVCGSTLEYFQVVHQLLPARVRGRPSGSVARSWDVADASAQV